MRPSGSFVLVRMRQWIVVPGIKFFTGIKLVSNSSRELLVLVPCEQNTLWNVQFRKQVESTPKATTLTVWKFNELFVILPPSPRVITIRNISYSDCRSTIHQGELCVSVALQERAPVSADRFPSTAWPAKPWRTTELCQAGLFRATLVSSEKEHKLWSVWGKKN